MSGHVHTAEHLPRSAQEISELIGLPGMLKLIDHYGGRRLFVPMHLRFDHKLARLLGEDVALKLCRAYGGSDLEIPRVPLRRHAALIADFNSGKSYGWLAAHYEMTERNVKHILKANGVSADDRQASLF